MAVDKFSASDANFIESVNNFESNVKKKLKWNKEKWYEAGEQGSRIHKLCNSLNYWKKSLKPAIADNVIVITLFDKDKDVRNDLFKVIEEIEKVDKIVTVKGITQFRNPRYLAVHFEGKVQADCVRNNFRMVENAFVVYLAWALDTGPESSTLKIHWIPMSVDIDTIKNALEEYVTCVDETRSALTLMSGRDVPLGKITFKVILNLNIKPENIPHLLNIADMEALVTMPGRAPLCLNCNLLGHISRECKQRYCKTCNAQKDKSHQCTTNNGKVSYAAALREGVTDVDPDDWGAAILPLADKSNSQEHDRLNNEINGLELQIAQIKDQELKNSELNLIKGALTSKILAHEKLNTSTDGKNNFSVEVLDEADVDSETSDVWSMEMEEEEEQVNSPLDQTLSETLNTKKSTGMTEKGKLGKNASSTKATRTKLNKATGKPELATYGKPNLNNSRRRKEAAKRLKEEAKFDTIHSAQTFVFSE